MMYTCTNKQLQHSKVDAAEQRDMVNSEGQGPQEQGGFCECLLI
jgi:hypothetical protein